MERTIRMRRRTRNQDPDPNRTLAVASPSENSNHNNNHNVHLHRRKQTQKQIHRFFRRSRESDNASNTVTVTSNATLTTPTSETNEKEEEMAIQDSKSTFTSSSDDNNNHNHNKSHQHHQQQQQHPLLMSPPSSPPSTQTHSDSPCSLQSCSSPSPSESNRFYYYHKDQMPSFLTQPSKSHDHHHHQFKIKHRRGRRSSWLNDNENEINNNDDEFFSSDPKDDVETDGTWQRIQSMTSQQQQIQAYWNFLYPTGTTHADTADRMITTSPSNMSNTNHHHTHTVTRLKSCLKQQQQQQQPFTDAQLTNTSATSNNDKTVLKDTSNFQTPENSPIPGGSSSSGSSIPDGTCLPQETTPLLKDQHHRHNPPKSQATKRKATLVSFGTNSAVEFHTQLPSTALTPLSPSKILKKQYHDKSNDDDYGVQRENGDTNEVEDDDEETRENSNILAMWDAMDLEDDDDEDDEQEDDSSSSSDGGHSCSSDEYHDYYFQDDHDDDDDYRKPAHGRQRQHKQHQRKTKQQHSQISLSRRKRRSSGVFSPSNKRTLIQNKTTTPPPTATTCATSTDDDAMILSPVPTTKATSRLMQVSASNSWDCDSGLPSIEQLSMQSPMAPAVAAGVPTSSSDGGTGSGKGNGNVAAGHEKTVDSVGPDDINHSPRWWSTFPSSFSSFSSSSPSSSMSVSRQPKLSQWICSNPAPEKDDVDRVFSVETVLRKLLYIGNNTGTDTTCGNLSDMLLWNDLDHHTTESNKTSSCSESPTNPSSIMTINNKFYGSNDVDDFVENDGGDDLNWLNWFDTCPPLRQVVHRSFLPLRGTMAMWRRQLPSSPNDHDADFTHDHNIGNNNENGLAELDWLQLQVQILQSIQFQLDTGLIRSIEDESDRLTHLLATCVTPQWIQQQLDQHQHSLNNVQNELSKQEECIQERARQTRLEQELLGAVACRYGHHLMRTTMPLEVCDIIIPTNNNDMEQDDGSNYYGTEVAGGNFDDDNHHHHEESQETEIEEATVTLLKFRRECIPIEGLQMLVWYKTDGSFQVEYFYYCDDEQSDTNTTAEGLVTTDAAASADDEQQPRIPSTHACATFYNYLLPACVEQITSEFAVSTSACIRSHPSSSLEGLHSLAFAVGRLEQATWQLYELSNHSDEDGSVHPALSVEATTNTTITTTADLQDLDYHSSQSAVVVVVQVEVSPSITFSAYYNLSDTRTLTWCCPTMAQLVQAKAVKATEEIQNGTPSPTTADNDVVRVQRHYPRQPFNQLLQSLLQEGAFLLDNSVC